ncbi:hypothetical protein JCM30394_10700 [Deferrisoma palaeochoriense]
MAGAGIHGDLGAIRLGRRTVVERGAVLSNKKGGRIALGPRCVVREGARLETFGGDIRLGAHCSVNPYAVLYGHGGLTIGDGVRIAAHVVIVPANHVFDDPETPIFRQPVRAEGIVIEDDVWVGAGARILDGVRVGRGAVIGAGAVVSKDVAPFTVNVGVPARPVGRRGA